MTIELVSAETLPTAMQALHASQTLVIDTEFHAERSYRPKLFLVQARVESGTTYIFDALKPKLLKTAQAALVDGKTWLLHAGQQDLRILFHLFGELPEIIHDTQIAGGLLESKYPASLVHLLSNHLGISLDKSATLSDWGKRPLSHEQLTYAVEDVRHLPELWDTLRAKLQACGRWDIALEACKDARQRVLEERTGPLIDRYRHLTGALTPRTAQAALLLAEWREDRAHERNQPLRTIMGDGTLRMLAKSDAKSLDDLKANRRLPKGLVNKHNAEVLALLEEARVTPDSELPTLLHLDPQAVLRHQFLNLALQTVASQEGFSTRLLMPQPLSAQLALTTSASRERIREVLGPWRDPLLGDLIYGILSGSKSMILNEGSVSLVNRN